MWVLLSLPYKRGSRGLGWLCGVPWVTSLFNPRADRCQSPKLFASRLLAKGEGAFLQLQTLHVVFLHSPFPALACGGGGTEKLMRSWLPTGGPVAACCGFSDKRGPKSEDTQVWPRAVLNPRPGLPGES